MNHYIIPVFIPELACPNRCIYCNQHCISGQGNIPSPDDLDQIIHKHLSTMPTENRFVEVGFFGGNFTGINLAMQKAFLKKAHSWVKQRKIDGVRISTRPDYVSNDTITLLLKYKVSCVELGVQSFDRKVLSLTNRGHTAHDSRIAASLIKESGIRLGMQMMIGLPGDSFQKSMDTARQIVEAGADNTRIYPTLVIKDTILADMYSAGQYQPLEMDEAIDQCAKLAIFFQKNGIRVLRMGLHPSKELMNNQALVAGPFHQSFGELVMSRMWKDDLTKLCRIDSRQILRIHVAPGQLNAAIGHKASNRRMLEQKHSKVVFVADNKLQGRDYHVDDY